MKRDVKYKRPLLINLKGKKGKRLLEFVRNLPEPNRAELEEQVEKYIQHNLRARENEKPKQLIKK